LSIPVGTVRSRLNHAREKLAEHWAKCRDNSDIAIKQSDEWNCRYDSYFTHVHSSLFYREKLIAHFDKNLQVVFTSGKSASGRQTIQALIEEDMLYGTAFCNVHVMSSGPVSVVEAHNRNPVEYPDRCPQNSIFVLFRQNGHVERIHVHNAS
jgi:hypothetical protein